MPPTDPAVRGKDVGNLSEDFGFAWEASGTGFNATKQLAMILQVKSMVTYGKPGRHVIATDNLAGGCHFRKIPPVTSICPV
jgi:hypothetical protein